MGRKWSQGGVSEIMELIFLKVCVLRAIINVVVWFLLYVLLLKICPVKSRVGYLFCPGVG